MVEDLPEENQTNEEEMKEYYSSLSEKNNEVITQNQAQRHQRIKIWMAWLLVIVAVIIDLIEILLELLGIGLFGLNFLIALLVSTIFWIWFLILGITYSSNTKKFATAIIQGILEIVPGQDLTIILSFAWTVGMILIVGMTRMEDRGEDPTIIGALREFWSISSPVGFVSNKIINSGKKLLK